MEIHLGPDTFQNAVAIGVVVILALYCLDTIYQIEKLKRNK